MPMEPSEKALAADMEDARRRLIAGSVYEALGTIQDMASICSLKILVSLESPGQVSGNVSVQVAYLRDSMAMSRREGDSLN